MTDATMDTGRISAIRRMFDGNYPNVAWSVSGEEMCALCDLASRALSAPGGESGELVARLREAIALLEDRQPNEVLSTWLVEAKAALSPIPTPETVMEIVEIPGVEGGIPAHRAIWQYIVDLEAELSERTPETRAVSAPEPRNFMPSQADKSIGKDITAFTARLREVEETTGQWSDFHAHIYDFRLSGAQIRALITAFNPPDDGEVERISRAICAVNLDNDENTQSDEEFIDAMWPMFDADARAALAALSPRHETEAVRAAIGQCVFVGWEPKPEGDGERFVAKIELSGDSIGALTFADVWGNTKIRLSALSAGETTRAIRA